MGVQEGEDGPAHKVILDSYYIAETEVTVKEWKQFTEAENIPFPWESFSFLSLVGRNVGFKMPEDWPIYYVTWYEAVWYCNWLSKKEGLEPAYEIDYKQLRMYLYERKGEGPKILWNKKANGYRLPTEAEWEFAATERGSLSELSAKDIDSVSWHRGNSGNSTHPVGTKLPNALGIYDMLGNVSEWCWDYFDADYYMVSPLYNPTGPDKGIDIENFGKNTTNIRSIRGHSWGFIVSSNSPKFRIRNIEQFRGSIGIRLARNP